MTKTIQIEGMDELIEAVGGGGGGGGNVPTPTLDDEGKVLMAIPQGQTDVKPGWEQINTVPGGGTQGQVLTKGASGYDWANASGGGSYPEPTSATDGQVLTADGWGNASWQDPSGGVPVIAPYDNGKVLKAIYDDKSGSSYAGWFPQSSGGLNAFAATGTVNIDDWAQSSGDYIGVITSSNDLPMPYLVISICAYYEIDFGNNRIVSPKGLSYDEKSGTLSIIISADDFNALDDVTGRLTVKIIYENNN